MSEAPSPAALVATRLVDAVGRELAHRALEVMLDKFTVVELAALAADWPFWARPKQLAPAGAWRSWGFLTARGYGKTKAIASHINDEVEQGRIGQLGLAAQNELKTIDAQVAALIETAPPWFAPKWESSKLELVWPNGAKAFAYTPEVPGAIRSKNLHMAWMSEVQSWPTATRDEAYANFLFATRIGYARTVWDATPKRRHPILKRLLARADEEPDKHFVVRGSIYENIANLGEGVVADLEREFGGTQKGLEELHGKMLEDSDSALVHQLWIDAARRHAPATLVRRVLGIDPAVTNRQGNDRTGIVDDGLGADGQVYVMGDYSGQHSADAWAAIVLDKYFANGCDCVVVETNKGGDLVTQNLRAHAEKRKLSVVVLGKTEPSRRTHGVVYVREVHARGAKEDRAQPLSTAYERGRISHVIGVDLSTLEELLTTWEPVPGQRSPDAIDAHVHASTELLGLLSNVPDGSQGFRGLTSVSKALAKVAPGSLNLGGRGGGRI